MYISHAPHKPKEININLSFSQKWGKPPKVDEKDAIDASIVVKQMDHRKSLEMKFFWEDLRDDTLWQEMIEYCYAADIDNEESRKKCFSKMCKVY
jgi:hypothetical protein